MLVGEMVGTARMPGTCGELVQGTLAGVPFHVSCPIDLYSHAEVRLSSDGKLAFPANCLKAGTAMRRTLELLGRPGLGATLYVNSSLPRGKGMASSTADVAGAIIATADALGVAIDPRQVADVALSVEPTDGSVFPDIVLFDHRGGTLCERLGPPPPIDVVALDFGGVVDTIAFNQEDRSAVLSKLEAQTGEALDMVRAGITLGDPLLVGQGATLSARANQDVLFKPQLETVIALARETDALGVNVGHSGTIIGVLIDRRRADGEAARQFLRRRLPELKALFLCSLVSGGRRVES